MNARSTALVFGLACTASLSPLTRAQDAPSQATARLDSHRSLGRPQTFRNLTLFPVYDSRATDGDDYLTLDEGLKSGAVVVKESANGGEVNTLYLTNRGKKPLYLMAGEVVLGGQQDRCIGADALVKAGAKKLPITVFCVEHGRWTGKTHFDASAITVASSEIRSSAQAGAFYFKAAAAAPGFVSGVPAHGLNVNTSAPMAQGSHDSVAPIGAAQQQVWARVAAKNRRFKTETESGTYRTLLNMTGGEAQTTFRPYLQALADAPGRDPHVAGMVAAINGKVVAADIFGNTRLFRRLWPKLLRSYAADAAENAQSGRRVLTVTATDAQGFLRQTADSKNGRTASGVTGVNTRFDAPQSVRYRLSDASRSAAALHENVLRK